MKDKLYNQEGEVAGELKLPERIFNLRPDLQLLSQAVRSQLANRRLKLAHTKDRGEVRGGGRKPWRQKGTGRARHGSRRSPLWTGGGVTFGPTKERNFSQKINKKTKRRAILMALASRWQDQQVWFLEKLTVPEPKTKILYQILRNLVSKFNLNQPAVNQTKSQKLPEILLILPRKEENLKKTSRNLAGIQLLTADSLNAYDLLAGRYIFLAKDSLPIIEKTFGS